MLYCWSRQADLGFLSVNDHVCEWVHCGENSPRINSWLVGEGQAGQSWPAGKAGMECNIAQNNAKSNAAKILLLEVEPFLKEREDDLSLQNYFC